MAERKLEIVVALEVADLGDLDEAWEAWAWTVEQQLEELATISKATVSGFTLGDVVA